MQHVPVAVLAAFLVAAPPSSARALGISRNDQQPNHAYRMVGVEPWSTLRHVCALMAGPPMSWPQALVGPRHSALQSPSPMTHTFEFETR